jgi:pseudouridine-5'-phosphate glycosidase
LPVDVRVDSAAAVAMLFKAQRELGVNSALVVAVPVPEDAEVPAETLAKILDEALGDAESKQVRGRELTPFLLSRMAQQSGGATLKANIALLENNARVAAEIALALAGTEII